MDTRSFNIGMAVVLALVGVMNVLNYQRLARRAAETPDDPTAARLVRLKWIYIVGTLFAFLGAIRYALELFE